MLNMQHLLADSLVDALMKRVLFLATQPFHRLRDAETNLGSRVPWVSRLMMAQPCRNPSSRDIKASCLAAAQTRLRRRLGD